VTGARAGVWTRAAGSLRWVYKTGAGNVGDPSLIVGGAVFFAADQWFIALDAATGALRWHVEYPKDDQPREKMPSTWGDVVFVVLNGRIEARLRDSGALAYTFKTDSQGWPANPQVQTSRPPGAAGARGAHGARRPDASARSRHMSTCRVASRGPRCLSSARSLFR
jgi:hypothetical protein